MIKLINITKKYHNQCLFNNLNLTISSPGVYLIEGESGCGKSTLLNIIGNFTFYKGKVINDYQNNMAYVFQNSYLIEHLLVRENLEFYHLDFSLLNKFNLSSVINNKVNELSMGEKSRLAYLIGMYTHKDLVLLDEPFSNLDKENALIMLKDILEFKDQKIIIIVSHVYRDLLINHGGKIIINKGKVRFIKDKNNQELVSSKNADLKINFKYLNKEFRYYLKDNIKMYLCIFILMIIIFFTNYLKGFFFNKINTDITNLVSDNKFYLSECKNKKINNIVIKSCANPSKEILNKLDEDKIDYKINYDFVLNNLFNKDNLSTYNKTNIHLLDGRLPLNEYEVIASNKYKLNQELIFNGYLLVNDEKMDIYSKELKVKVVGIYHDLTFYNDDNIYFDYKYLDDYFNKEMLINNQYSLKEYFLNLETTNYKYVIFSNKDIDYLTLTNPSYSYYLTIKEIYKRSSNLIDYLLIYLIAFSLYLIFRFNKNRMNLKKKTNAFLMANSFNKNRSYFACLFYDFIYLGIVSFLFIGLSYLLDLDCKLISIYSLLILLLILVMTSYYFNKNNVGKLMREEVW